MEGQAIAANQKGWSMWQSALSVVCVLPEQPSQSELLAYKTTLQFYFTKLILISHEIVSEADQDWGDGGCRHNLSLYLQCQTASAAEVFDPSPSKCD